MAEKPLPKPNFSVCFEPANSLIRISWQGTVSEKELLDGYKAALVVIEQNPVQRILIDQSRRRLNLAFSPDPLFKDLFNEALKLIGNTLFLAMVVSPEEYYLTSEETVFGKFEQAVNDYVIVERFINKADAEVWLATVN
ncbi:hypothetical protein I5M27_01440 [Adhaeribacter sp. BT258]|uniref:SpoIIAA-like n=1 Tax=Adhaeribacter terrigena TaxID=2793070 RepID=A0ABS1BX16_9BACT|nr:hypothetical protein [Adhaeribacter terrigena]MBK0401627.1 hypothetical protein [Adhaeribacter terrigena]